MNADHLDGREPSPHISANGDIEVQIGPTEEQNE